MIRKACASDTRVNMPKISIELAQKTDFVHYNVGLYNGSEYAKTIHRVSTKTDFVHYNAGLHNGAL